MEDFNNIESLERQLENLKNNYSNVPFIRVGITYFKKIQRLNRYGIVENVLKKWSKEEIKDDYGKDYLKVIPKYDDFVIEPNNKNYQSSILNNYNLYNQFNHKEKKGDLKVTLKFLRHVFGEQYDLGLKYMQALYLYPKWALPILILTSKARSTGKTTFMDWLNVLFGDNCVIIDPQDLTSNFNSEYASANIICVDESHVKKSSTVERVKTIATSKYISYKRKFVDASKIPFFGKLVMATNKETEFIKIDDEEIRFWIRKLNEIPYEDKNANIDIELAREIPAFLFYLSSLPPLTFEKSRMLFEATEIDNEELIHVKEESKSTLYKDITEFLTDYFDTNDVKYISFTAKDIKDNFFKNDNSKGLSYIRKVLKEEFKYEFSKTTKSYYPLNTSNSSAKTGKICTININLKQINDKPTKEELEELNEFKGELPF